MRDATPHDLKYISGHTIRSLQTGRGVGSCVAVLPWAGVAGGSPYHNYAGTVSPNL
jgi:hypothetical protein